MGAPHRTFGSVLAELFLGQAGDDDRQFVRGQCVCVMEDGGDRQIFTSHRAVNNHLQTLDRGEYIDGAPVASGAVVV